MSVDKFGRYSTTGEKSSVFNKNYGLPVTLEGDYNIGNKRLKFVNDPKDNSDAINLRTLKAEVSTCLKLEGNGSYNAKDCRIINIADPKNKQDSVTKEYVDTHISTGLKIEGNTYNARGKQIQNVGDPILPSDVVTIQYMNKMTPILNHDNWNFSNKRLSNIQNPSYGGEAVNLTTLKSLAICKNKKTDEYYDAKDLKVSNIGNCIQDGDAVNKRMLNFTVKTLTRDNEKHLERLGAAIFRYIHRSSGRAADPDVLSSNYLNWEEIHKAPETSSKLNQNDNLDIIQETEENEDNVRTKRI